jgi:hypothetical protein
VLAVDGGSTDASVAIAEAAGLLVVRHETGTGVLLAALAVLAHHLSGRRSAA